MFVCWSKKNSRLVFIFLNYKQVRSLFFFILLLNSNINVSLDSSDYCDFNFILPYKQHFCVCFLKEKKREIQTDKISKLKPVTLFSSILFIIFV
jgi:hypothetical protein